MLRPGAKRRFITLEEKIRVIQEIEANPQISRTSIAHRLGIPVTTLKSIYIKREEIRRYAAEAGPSGFKRGRSQNGMYADLEKVLFAWVRERRDHGSPITGTLLKEKALQVAREMGISEDFKASSGWVDKFRKRHGISGRSYGSDATPNVSDWRAERLPQLTSNYRMSDIYQLGETGLYYDSWLNKADEADERPRLVVVVGVNGDGSDKLPLLVVGKDEDPRGSGCAADVPVEYVCDPEERVTSSLLQSQLEKLDRRMRREGRQVLVLLDRCGDAAPRFDNVQAEFFPLNHGSNVRPLDFGIPDAITTHYQKLLAQKALAIVKPNHTLIPTQVTLLETLYLMAEAWHDVPPDLTSHCFRLAGIAGDPATKPEAADHDERYDDALPVRVEMKEEWDEASDEASGEASDAAESKSADLPDPETPTVRVKEEPAVEAESDAETETDAGPTFAEALRAYETVARYVASRRGPPEDVAAMDHLARVLYSASSAPVRRTDT